ncbi:hypothetical protein DPMN_142508 [Dreissena polymorpha]|uniref:Ig-like domain-containing protein n=1 Tax=Dreissena polymorpha TaxID=45954 RepID=A0A9D4GEK3_DREPO|nr:hypothetical protein DPMN_142508 [Dreissena polymorpha]
MWLQCGVITFTIVLNIYRIGTEAPVLTSNATLVKVNEALKLTCTHPTATVVRWLRQPAGDSTSSIILAMNNVCEFNPTTLSDVFSTCVCNGTRFTCTLKPLDTINNGEKWKCAVNINFQATLSNEITLKEQILRPLRPV